MSLLVTFITSLLLGMRHATDADHVVAVTTIVSDQPSLWRAGAVQFANHTCDETMPGLARRILGEAPQRFALVGHSMGGYVAFEMLRQAPQRIERVAFLDTSALPDASTLSGPNSCATRLRNAGIIDVPPISAAQPTSS